MRRVDALVGRFRSNEALYSLCIASAIVMTCQSVVAPVLPLFAADFVVTTAVVGLSVSLFGAARLLFNVPFGVLADRHGRRPVLVAGPLIIAVSMVGCARSGNIGTFLAWRCLGGAGSAMFMTGAQAYIADISTSATRTRNIASNQAALWIGVSIGPALGGFLAEWFGLAAPFYVVGACGVLAAIHVHLRLPETFPGRHERPIPGAAAERTPWSRRPAMQLVRSRDFIAVSVVCLALFVSRAAGQQVLMPLHANDDLGMSTSDLGIVFTLIAVVNLVALAPSAQIADRLGRKWAIVPACMVAASGLALMGLSTTPTYFIAGALVYGIGVSLAGPAPVVYATDIAPPQLRGLSLGLYRSVGDFGFTVGPFVIGAVADATSIGLGLQITASLFVVAGVGFAVLARETVGRRGDNSDAAAAADGTTATQPT